MVTTSDIPRSLGFYEGLLGGRVTYRFPEEDPGFVTVEVGGAPSASAEGRNRLPRSPTCRMVIVADPDGYRVVVMSRR